MKRLAVICAVLLASCTKENAFDCFKSSGPERRQARYTGDFRNISLADKMDVTVRQGPFRVEVTAGQNLFTEIDTYVKNDTLFLENNNLCNFVRGYKRTIHIDISLPYLRRAVNNGVGTLRIEGFTQDTIVVRAESSGDIHLSGTYSQVRTSSHGNGDMYLAGSCSSLFIYTKGINYTYADEMAVSDYCFIESLSIGDASLNATKLARLECNIHEDGNVYYTGLPVVRDFSDGSGRGQLVKR